MTGFVLAFCSALFTAASDAFSKKALAGHSLVVIAWVRFAYTAPFLLPLAPAADLPHLDPTFWTVIAVLAPLETAAMLLYMKALQVSPLSLTAPFLSLTPVFTILTSFLILGELPDGSGAAGILLIVCGAYFLHASLTRKGILEPLKAIGRERGSLLMIGVAFIYSISSNLGKLAIQHSSAAFMGIFYLPLISLCLLPLAVGSGMRIRELRKGGRLFLLIGLSQALMALAHFQAIALMLVPYMISVKRLSLLFSVLCGGIFFHEEHLAERLAGSLLMVAGVVLILV